jgi:hypothetical protein
MPIQTSCMTASFFILLFISCSSYRKFIRVDPRLAVCKNDIDTIAVFSDALVAIKSKKSFFSENSSCLLDTIIQIGAQKSLAKKGYGTRQINSVFSGSFLDSSIHVPVKKINSDKIDTTRLPSVFKNDLSENQRMAFKRTCRGLYLQTIYTTSNQISLKISTPIVKSDLDTLRKIINCDHVLFIFNRSTLFDPSPEVATGMAVGTLALTTILSGGTIFGYIYPTQGGVFRTYMILIKLSTGNILWSNFSTLDAAPFDPLLEISKNHWKSLSGYMNKDILDLVSWRWQEFILEAFPGKADKKIFMGHKKKYPSQDLK